jgi:hypothetical protein
LRRADMQSYEAVHSSTWRRTTFLKSALHWKFRSFERFG